MHFEGSSWYHALTGTRMVVFLSLWLQGVRAEGNAILATLEIGVKRASGRRGLSI